MMRPSKKKCSLDKAVKYQCYCAGTDDRSIIKKKNSGHPYLKTINSN